MNKKRKKQLKNLHLNNKKFTLINSPDDVDINNKNINNKYINESNNTSEEKSPDDF
jgi:hypothetical protein